MTTISSIRLPTTVTLSLSTVTANRHQQFLHMFGASTTSSWKIAFNADTHMAICTYPAELVEAASLAASGSE